MNKLALALALVSALVWVAPAAAQTPDAAAAPSLLRKLDLLKGTWVGEAKGIGPGGKPYAVRQTERPPRTARVNYAWRGAARSRQGRALQWWLRQLESPATRLSLLTRQGHG